MPTFQLSPEVLISVASIVLSLGFSYIPGLSTWFAGIEGDHKRLIMLALILIVTAGAFGLGCAGILVIQGFSCSSATALEFVWTFIMAAIANQAAYQLSPQTKAVKAVKAARDNQ